MRAKARSIETKAPAKRDAARLLRCPVSERPLVSRGGALVTADGKHRYPVDAEGIACFAESYSSPEARRQEAHFAKVQKEYLESLTLPHVEEYSRYLNGALARALGTGTLGDVAEVCCGPAEGFALLHDRIESGVGVDISLPILKAARRNLPSPRLSFLQADATRLPLASDAFDTVLMLGGIHHVPDRRSLFAEAYRVLKPGGRLVWREPVSDFFLWRWLRAVVYRASPNLDAETERPLRYEETVPPLEAAGFRLGSWETYGFLGFCVFMNADVLVVNRLFRYVPGIRAVTRAAVALDELTRRLPGTRRWGTQVIGVATKPAP